MTYINKHSISFIPYFNLTVDDLSELFTKYFNAIKGGGVVGLSGGGGGGGGGGGVWGGAYLLLNPLFVYARGSQPFYFCSPKYYLATLKFPP